MPENITKHLFVSPNRELRSNWKEAFLDATAVSAVPATPNADVIWVLLPWEGEVVQLLTAAHSAAGAVPVIAMSDVPDDTQGLAALGAGVAGYCNGHADPVVLQLVATTVLNGGIWVGQSLMQRLMTTTANMAAQKFAPPDPSAWATGLTRREADVARTVALGSSNKEIARMLNISERTVKAHLGAIFEKLKVRDRLQLTLLVNGIIKS